MKRQNAGVSCERGMNTVAQDLVRKIISRLITLMEREFYQVSDYQKLREQEAIIMAALSHPSVPNGRSAGEAVADKALKRLAEKLEDAAECLEDSSEWGTAKSYARACRKAKKLLLSIASPPAADGMVLVPREPTLEWLKQVACDSGVWPHTDMGNVPSAITEAIRNYHRAMLAAQPDESKGG